MFGNEGKTASDDGFCGGPDQHDKVLSSRSRTEKIVTEGVAAGGLEKGTDQRRSTVGRGKGANLPKASFSSGQDRKES